MVRVVHYVSEDGKDYFDIWFRSLSLQARSRIQTRIDRVEIGNFGDCKSVGRGVFELRIDFGPGYRLYFGRDGDDLVIVLGGGTKKRQSRDIAQAQIHWDTYRQEKRNAN
ncbi:MAG: type II toxin-antitoxin system RelE/ParE family toxin [Gammaproteobacteria bacterium]|nr:type II toxin-antitoxin system RelE/ParE family toxin [Gammaproteobacteria bacterium]